MKGTAFLAIACILSLLTSGCGSRRTPPPTVEHPRRAEIGLAMMGYVIQAGAFRNIDNAVRFCEELKSKGINAYYFIDPTINLYKVRFGNFQTFDAARQQAERIMAEGFISDFYIVKPDSYAAAKLMQFGTPFLRRQIIETAMSFLGTPYKWGGESVEEGFDCSGLTMVSYQMNGLALPRNSREQFKAGRHVNRHELQPGDLVFFATNGGSMVSHVGIYLGNDSFIHAPKKGDHIRTSSLENGYFNGCFVGGRTYM